MCLDARTYWWLAGDMGTLLQDSRRKLFPSLWTTSKLMLFQGRTFSASSRKLQVTSPRGLGLTSGWAALEACEVELGLALNFPVQLSWRWMLLMPVGTSPPAARPLTHLEGLNHLLQAGIMVVRHISRVNLWSWVLVEIPLKLFIV